MVTESSPIGVFDSGMGGITVLKQLVNLMPNEKYIFYGDSANAPYGKKSSDTVRKLTMSTAAKLYEMGCKCLVVACNTATSVAINVLRDTYRDIPVIGIEPALKPAVLANEGGHILVLATNTTLHEEKFNTLMNRYESKARISTLAAPGIVEFVENGITCGTQLEEYIADILSPYQEDVPNAIVLGCTHFPFVADTIKKVIGNQVTLYDGGKGTAASTHNKLDEYLLSSREPSAGDTEITFCNSDPDPAKTLLMKQFFDSYVCP